MINGDPDLASQLHALDPAVREMLREDLPAQLAIMESALEQGDFVAATGAVHTIHGSASFCKLTSLQTSAKALEDSLRNNDKNAELIGAFRKAVNEVLLKLG